MPRPHRARAPDLHRTGMCLRVSGQPVQARGPRAVCRARGHAAARSGPEATNSLSRAAARSEEHTSELQSRVDLVCRLLLEKKKKNKTRRTYTHSLSEL